MGEEWCKMGEKWARSSSGLICPSCPTDSPASPGSRASSCNGQRSTAPRGCTQTLPGRRRTYPPLLDTPPWPPAGSSLRRLQWSHPLAECLRPTGQVSGVAARNPWAFVVDKRAFMCTCAVPYFAAILYPVQQRNQAFAVERRAARNAKVLSTRRRADPGRIGEF